MAKRKIPEQKPTQSKTVGIQIRIDEELNRRFSAILSLKKETATDFFKRSIETYVKENYQEAMELLDIQKQKYMTS